MLPGTTQVWFPQFNIHFTQNLSVKLPI